MPPTAMLGKLRLGDSTSLPNNYLDFRNKGSEINEDQYHVVTLIDDEENVFYIISYGQPTAHACEN